MQNKTTIALVAALLAFVPVASACDIGDLLAQGDVEVDIEIGEICDLAATCNFSYLTDDHNANDHADFGSPFFLSNVTTAGAITDNTTELDEDFLRFLDGSIVEDTDDESGETIIGRPYTLGFVDDDDNGEFDLEEVNLVYVNIRDAAGFPSNTSVGDFRVHDSHFITASEDDHRAPITPFLNKTLFVDLDANGEYDFGEIVFVDTDDDGEFSAGDLILWGHDYGIATINTPYVDANSALIACGVEGQDSVFGYVDLDQDGTRDADEPYALAPSTHGLKLIVDSVVLSGTHVGTIVTGAHALFDKVFTPFAAGDNTVGDLVFVDEEGEGNFDFGELIVLDTNAPALNTLTPGDVDVFNGKRVTFTGYDIDSQLSMDDFFVNCVDTDADGEFGGEDTVLLGLEDQVTDEDDLILAGGDFMTQLGGLIFVAPVEVDITGDMDFCATLNDDDVPTNLYLNFDGAFGDVVVGITGNDAGMLWDWDDWTDYVDDDLDVDYDCTWDTLDGWNFTFVDEHGDGDFDAAEDMIVLQNDTTIIDEDISLGDFLFNGPRVLQNSNFDIGVETTNFTMVSFFWIDNDDDDEMDGDDNYYVSFGDSGVLEIDDMFLYCGEDLNAGGSSSTPTPTATSTPTATATPTASNTGSGSSSGSGSGTGNGGSTQTPGFELVALVAALGAALVLVRRRL